ncbi:MAG: magnesium/cobalt transporter CorA [Anaerolineae bacterium]|nr:MAG: magnesium/cobalt transporter CorA [Anaerolineae bacterium]
MIRSLYRAHDGRVHADTDPEQLGAALQDADGLLWVDLVSEPADSCAPILRETFAFHPLAVDDALEEKHVPKVDDWGTYIYVVLHAVVFDPQGGDLLHTLELDVFMGQNYVVTYQAQPIAAVDRVWTACQRDERHLQRGAAHLLYELADELVADYMPAVEAMDEAIDQIEDQIFDKPGPSLLERIFTLKRALLRLRRMVAPQREVLNKLARGDYGVIDAEDRVFFRDVYDHLVRLHDITESLRDLLGGALDTYLSVVSNRMNEVMKILTVITTLFMPISFLAGFFGMNFFQPATPLDTWTDQPVLVLTIAAMVLLPLGMYLWMRKRAWM